MDHPTADRIQEAQDHEDAARRAAEGTWTLDDMRRLSGKAPPTINRHERRRYAALSRRALTR